MNLPNLLTLSRVPMMFVIVALMYWERLGMASLCFWLFIASAISDWLDGYIARKRKLISDFGKFADALTDKIMVLGIMVAFVDKQTLPIAYVLITLCREFLVSGMRMIAASRGVVVAADGGGKTKTVTQLIAIGFLLAEPMVSRDWAYLLPGYDLCRLTEAVHYVGIGAFIVGTFLAVWSGFRYFRNNWTLILSESDK